MARAIENAAQRFQGRSDRPLTPLGLRQAVALASELASSSSLSVIYTSPLRRALETAAVVGEHVGLEPVPDDDLREVDVGSWTGLSRAEVEARYPDAFERWLGGGEGWDDGESYAEMSARVLAALVRISGSIPGDELARRLPRRADPRDPGGGVGVDVHAYRKLRRVEPNAGLSRVAVEGGRITRLD